MRAEYRRYGRRSLTTTPYTYAAQTARIHLIGCRKRGSGRDGAARSRTPAIGRQQMEGLTPDAWTSFSALTR